MKRLFLLLSAAALLSCARATTRKDIVLIVCGSATSLLPLFPDGQTLIA